MTFTDPYGAIVTEALTRECSACDKPKGKTCVCTLHVPAHDLNKCPTSSGRVVHHMREKPKPKGGD